MPEYSEYEQHAGALANTVRELLKTYRRAHEVRSHEASDCVVCRAKRVLRAFDNGVTDEDRARETMERNQARR